MLRVFLSKIVWLRGGFWDIDIGSEDCIIYALINGYIYTLHHQVTRNCCSISLNHRLSGNHSISQYNWIRLRTIDIECHRLFLVVNCIDLTESLWQELRGDWNIETLVLDD